MGIKLTTKQIELLKREGRREDEIRSYMRGQKQVVDRVKSNPDKSKSRERPR